MDLILFSVFQTFLVAGLKKNKQDISVDWSGDFYFLYRLFAAYIYMWTKWLVLGIPAPSTIRFLKILL